MSKTNYPGKIDGHKELPVLRDDILQSGVTAVNALRSAIIEIEKTLGINPNAQAGSTVASRLSKSLDDVGNIKKEALDYLNLLSGPISDSDIKDDANISEQKVNLDFSTNFLYNQILSSYRNIEELSNTISNLSSSLSAHLNKSSTGRHYGINIQIDAVPPVESDVALRETSSVTLHDFLSSIISSHINYSGANIGPENNSHSSSQIYYNNSLYGELAASNVQAAIDELSVKPNYDIISHQSSLHSNGISKFYSKEKILISQVQASFSRYNYSSSSIGSTVTMVTPFEDPGVTTLDFIKTIRHSQDVYFAIKNITYDSSGLISAIETVENATFDSSSTEISIVRLTTEDSGSAFNLARISNPNLTVDSGVILALPTAPSIYSKNVNVSKISSSNRYLKIAVGSKEYEVDCLVTGNVTIQTVVAKINEEFSELGAPLIAYVDYGYNEKLYISHMLESDGARYIKLIQGSDNLYLDFGLSDFLDKEIYNSEFSEAIVNGKSFTEVKTKISSDFFTINPSLTIESAIGSELFNFGVKKGDIIVIEGSNYDDGAYIIDSVLDYEISIIEPYPGFLFVGQSQNSGATFTVKASSVSFLDYLLASSFSGNPESGLYNIYLNSNFELTYFNKLKYSSISHSLPQDQDLIQIMKSDALYSENGSLDVSVDEVNKVYISFGQNKIYISDSDNSFFKTETPGGNSIELYIHNYSNLKSHLVSSGSQTISYEITPGIDSRINFLVGSVLFQNYNGRIFGMEEFFPNKSFGYGQIEKHNLSSLLLEEILSIYSKLGSESSIEYGCEIYGAIDDGNSNYKFSITSGKLIAGGKEIYISEKDIYTNIPFSSSSDKLYIGVSSSGNIIYKLSNTSGLGCNCPFDLNTVAILAVINYKSISSSDSFETIDLRMFSENIIEMNLGRIYVSADKAKRNFRSIPSALKYAKNLSFISEKYGVPKIVFGPGEHIFGLEYSIAESDRYLETNFLEIVHENYDNGFLIDFPVIIEGCGESSILSFYSKWSNSTTPVSNSSEEYLGRIVVAGENILASSFAPQRVLAQGLYGAVKFKDLTIKNTQIFCIENVSSTYSSASSSNAKLIFDNVNIIRDSYSSVDPTFLVHTEDNSASHYFNPILFNNCKIENALIKFSDNTSGSNGKYVSNISFLSCSLLQEYTSNRLIEFNLTKLDASDPEYVYGLKSFQNLYSVNFSFYYKQSGQPFYPSDFISNKERVIVNSPTLEVKSDSVFFNTSGTNSIKAVDGNYISMDDNSSYLFLEPNNATISSSDTINLSSAETNLTSDTINLSSDTINLSSSGTNLTSDSTIYISSNIAQINSGTGSLSEFSQDITLTSQYGSYVNIGSDVEVYSHGTTTFSSDVKFSSTYQGFTHLKLLAKFTGTYDACLLTTCLSNDASGSYLPCFNWNATPSSSEFDHIMGYHDTDVVYGTLFVPHYNGKIKRFSVVNKGSSSTSSSSIIWVYKHNGTGPITSGTSWSFHSASSTAAKSVGAYSSKVTDSNISFEEGAVYCFIYSDPSGKTIEVDLLIEYNN